MNDSISGGWIVVIVILGAWEFVWKAVALWKAGRSNQLAWFVALLLLNTAGILPIIYILTSKKEAEEKI